MTHTITSSPSSPASVLPAPAITRRRPFQAPQIILERELKALAQGLGPFNGSN